MSAMPELDPGHGFVPALPPNMGPDGSAPFDPASLKPLAVDPIGLCTLGPCRCYHELHVRMDAQDPLDNTPGRVYVNVVRTCYPASGIEFPLDAAVKHCNRWEPLHGDGHIAAPRAADSEHGWASYSPVNRDAWDAFQASWAAVSNPNPSED